MENNLICFFVIIFSITFLIYFIKMSLKVYENKNSSIKKIIITELTIYSIICIVAGILGTIGRIISNV